MALRQAENKAGRLKLVGIRMEDDDHPARDGALIVDSKVRGYVATMRKSFTTGQAVGMALVESQLAGKGTRLEIFEDECNGVRLYARVVDTPFYDVTWRKNEKLVFPECDFGCVIGRRSIDHTPSSLYPFQNRLLKIL